MILINEELCCYCGSCVAVCPENIIELIDTHLKIDHQKCRLQRTTSSYRITCGICIKGCPIGVLKLKDQGSE